MKILSKLFGSGKKEDEGKNVDVEYQEKLKLEIENIRSENKRITAEYEKKLLALENRLRSANKNIDGYKTDILRLKDELKEKSEKLTSWEVSAKESTDRVEDLKSRLSTLTDLNRDKNNEAKSLASKLKRRDAKIAQLEEVLDQMRGSVEESSFQVARAGERESEASSKLNEIQVELDGLKKVTSEKIKESLELKRKISERDLLIEELSESVDLLRGEKKSFKDKYVEVLKKYDLLKGIQLGSVEDSDSIGVRESDQVLRASDAEIEDHRNNEFNEGELGGIFDSESQIGVSSAGLSLQENCELDGRNSNNAVSLQRNNEEYLYNNELLYPPEVWRDEELIINPEQDKSDVLMIIESIDDVDSDLDGEVWFDDEINSADFNDEYLESGGDRAEIDAIFAEEKFIYDDVGPSSFEMSEPLDKVSRVDRARQVAIAVAEKYELGADGVKVLHDIFLNNWWSSAKKSVVHVLDRGASILELQRTYSLRNIWIEYPEFSTYSTSRGDIVNRKSVISWSLALDFIRSFQGIPSNEEVEEYLLESNQYWLTHHGLHANFPSYLLYIKSLIENRRDGECLPPPYSKGWLI